MPDLYRAFNDRLLPVPETTLAYEQLTEPAHLESWIANLSKVFERDVLWVSRQGHLDLGRSDLVGIDADGDLLVVELKRGEVTEDALTQGLRYVAEYALLGRGQLEDKLAAYPGPPGGNQSTAASAQAQMAEHTGENPVNQAQVVILVGEGFAASTLQIADYLNGALSTASPLSFSVECWRVGLHVDEDRRYIVVTRVLPTATAWEIIEERKESARDAKYGKDIKRRNLRSHLQHSAALLDCHPRGIQGGVYVFDVTPPGLTTSVRVAVEQAAVVVYLRSSSVVLSAAV